MEPFGFVAMSSIVERFPAAVILAQLFVLSLSLIRWRAGRQAGQAEQLPTLLQPVAVTLPPSRVSKLTATATNVLGGLFSETMSRFLRVSSAPTILLLNSAWSRTQTQGWSCCHDYPIGGTSKTHLRHPRRKAQPPPPPFPSGHSVQTEAGLPCASSPAPSSSGLCLVSPGKELMSAVCQMRPHWSFPRSCSLLCPRRHAHGPPAGKGASSPSSSSSRSIYVSLTQVPLRLRLCRLSWQESLLL